MAHRELNGYVTPNSQDRDLIFFDVLYLHNSARQTHGHNKPFI